MRIKRLFAVVALLGLLALAGGCSSNSGAGSDAAAGSDAPASTTVATSSNAGTNEKADWPEKIVIVQMPVENNPDSGSTYDGFRTALEDYLGIQVEEMEGSEYAVGIEAMKAAKLDIILVSPMSYYQAKQVANVEPLVTTTSQGPDPYKTVFITQADRDDINSLEDLRDKTFAFVDPASSSGYMYPKAKLVVDLGLDPDQLETPGYFFQTVTYSGKHDTSLIGVAKGDYDAAAIGLGVIRAVEEAGLIDSGDIKIFAETEVIPNACFLIRGDLPQDLKDMILDFYLQYDDPGYFSTLYGDPDVRFIEAYDSDYIVVDQMIQILNIEEEG